MMIHPLVFFSIFFVLGLIPKLIEIVMKEK